MSRQSILSSNKNHSDLHWSFLQVKGTFEDEFNDADLISCVEFNSTGKLLACGDKGGRIVIFQIIESKKSNEYDLYCTFQSHEAEFDYLKSLEIEEKINKICWLDESKTAANHYMLTTNDKTIKLWKLSERDKRIDDSFSNVSKNLYHCDNNEDYFFDLSELRVPKILPVEPTVQSNLRKIFSNAHTFHINSVSINSDQETFISSDELRINLWNLEVTDESFVIVDIKPSNMEDLTEVISAAEFHPQHCHIFAYSTSKGSIKLCDMREAALCDQYSKIFQDNSQDNSTSNFFYELISVISDLKFSYSGRYMITRDYMTVKVWDLNMEREPLETYQVHEYLRGKLCSLYENDYIFDKFECSLSGNDNFIMTGSYNLFKIIDRETKQESLFEINKDVVKQKYLRAQKVVTMSEERNLRRKSKKDEILVDHIDLNKRIYHMAWNPRKIRLEELKHCFISLPFKWEIVNVRQNVYNLRIMKMVFVDDVNLKFIYVTWNGTRNFTEDCIFLDRTFANQFNINNMKRIILHVVDDIQNLPPCITCHLKPLTENDYQLITINAQEIECQLLNQLRIITTAFLNEDQFSIYPLWLKTSPNVPIFVKVVKITPNHFSNSGVIITKDTKIVISLDEDLPNQPKCQEIIPQLNIPIRIRDKSYLSVPIYSGKSLFLRIIPSEDSYFNNFTAFISSSHFERLKGMGIEENYCLIKLEKVYKTNELDNFPLNVDMSMFTLEEKFCTLFVHKFLNSWKCSNVIYLLALSNPDCPIDSIIMSHSLIFQRNLPIMSYISVSDFDPSFVNLSANKINDINCLLVPIAKEVFLIWVNLGNGIEMAGKEEISKEFKKLIPDQNNEHLFLWNGLTLTICSNKFIILNQEFPLMTSEAEINQLLLNCFIINYSTQISIQTITINNPLIVEFLDKKSHSLEIVEFLSKNYEDIISKPFVGQEENLNKCLQFICNSLNLNSSFKNESSLFTTLLITGSKGSGKSTLIKRILYEFSSNYIWSEIILCPLFKGQRIERIQKHLEDIFNQAFQCQPSIVILEDLDQIAYEPSDENATSKSAESFYCERISYIIHKFIDTLRKMKSSSSFSRMAIILSAESYSKLNILFQKFNCFDQVIEIQPLTSRQKTQIIKEIFDKKDYSLPGKEKIKTALNIDIKRLCQITKKFNAQQLIILIDIIIHQALVNTLSIENDICSNVVNINDEHVQLALNKFNNSNIKETNLKLNTKRLLSDVGGMHKVKAIISDLILMQIKHPNLYQNLPLKLPNSILLYGMPGTGKTSIVEAIANETGLNFISVKGPELLSKYLGSSERSVRKVFERAQKLAPSLLFFDEFDSLAPRRGHDSAGVMDRVVNQMLTMLDGLEERKQNIFIIAATSRPDLIDLALLRPGRFDQTVLCDLPNEDERKEIFLKLCRKLPIDVNTIPFNQLVKSTEKFSGADIQALLYNAFLDATKQGSSSSSCHQVTCHTNNSDFNEEPMQPFNKIAKTILIEWKHLERSLAITKPSLSEQERNKFIKRYTKFESELSGQNSETNNEQKKFTFA